jgi:hypothetical protein
MLFLAKATAAAKKTGPKFVMSVCDALTKFLSDLSTSSVVESVPIAIRLGFLQLRKSIEKHRPALASIMPSAFFLHILSPCIMLPASDIAELFSSDNLQPVLTMSTKVRAPHSFTRLEVVLYSLPVVTRRRNVLFGYG